MDGIIEAEDVRGEWEKLSLERKRAIIDALMVVTIDRTKRGRGWHPEHIGITWRDTN